MDYGTWLKGNLPKGRLAILPVKNRINLYDNILKFQYLKAMNEKHTIYFLAILLVFILTLTGMAYHYRGEIHIPRKLMAVKDRFFSIRGPSVKFDVATSIGDQHLWVKFSAPCINMRHKNQILKRLPKIKHELLMSMSRPEVIQAIEVRDFKSIKKHSLQIINNFSPELINKLYLEFFFLN